MIEYLMFRKERLSVADLRGHTPWDTFLSSYNESERVKAVFDVVPAGRKSWLVADEYGYEDRELPQGQPSIRLGGGSEADAIVNGIAALGQDFEGIRLCVDITGFMRPHILFLVKYLARLGVEAFDVVYSEPVMYKSKEATQFALGEPHEVRQVAGFEGGHVTDVSNDLLLIGAGYDDVLVSRVVGQKESARVVFLYGLPSLSADMYQQSVMRMSRPADAVQGRLFRGDGVAFASANDPFVTAAVMSDLCRDARIRDAVKNIYLCPVGTKPQTLGFALAFLNEFEETPTSIIFPFSRSYAKETSTGVGRVWVYHIELGR
jgi:hypothetical protein